MDEGYEVLGVEKVGFEKQILKTLIVGSCYRELARRQTGQLVDGLENVIPRTPANSHVSYSSVLSDVPRGRSTSYNESLPSQEGRLVIKVGMAGSGGEERSSLGNGDHITSRRHGGIIVVVICPSFAKRGETGPDKSDLADSLNHQGSSLTPMRLADYVELSKSTELSYERSAKQR